MEEHAKRLFEFGSFRVDPVERVLLRGSESVALTSKLFDILLLLVENNGRVVEKERLMREVWPGTFVEEGNLTQNISLLRKVLKDDGHQYIQTVPRRGYRFVGHIHEVVAERELIIEEHSRSRVIVEEHHTDAPEIHQSSAAIVRTPGSSDALRSRAKWKPGLTTLLVSVALAGIAIATAYFASSGRPKGFTTVNELPEPRSIAVLPFQTLNVNAGDEFLGLGMTDALISRLSNIRQANVRPTSAVQKYSGRQQEAATVGKELRVDSVLEGTVQKDGDRIRVSVQLIDVKEGKTFWAHAFDEKSTDIFAVEDAISEKIAQAMTLKLTEGERARLAKHYTEDPAAHEFYLQGRFYLNKFTEDGTKLARKYFEQAIAKDSHYAEAYSGLAESYAFGEIGLPPEEAFPKARDAATRALDLDETVGEAHAALAQVDFLWDWDWPAAEKQFKRALELTPGDPEIHHMYAHYLSAMGRLPEALAESQRLLELDPLSPASRNHLGWHYLYAHEFDLAIEQYKLVLALDPNFAEAHRQLAEAYSEKGRFDEAVDEMNRRFDLIGRGDEVPELRKAYSAFGWKGFWKRRLQFTIERSKHAYMSPSGTASIYVELRDTPEALSWLERAYREHDHDLVYLKVDHTWDNLRSEPRFQELLRRMRLA
jgi:DNA-binding winged helix-turn-helix (wHTH) protein/TolB-like protein/tetratricopeptide (TPR) repeat protein